MPSSFSKYLRISLLSTLIAIGSGTCLAEKVVAVETIPLDTILPENRLIEQCFCTPTPTERMPLFPGCEDAATYSSQKKCADSLLVAFIYENLRWPNSGACVEGTAVISFTVTALGELEAFEITRDPGGGTGAEALRVVKLMAKQTAPWSPGTQGVDKKPIAKRFHLPVKFKLE